MREYLISAALAAAFCFLITPLTRNLSMHSGAFGQLRERDIHTTITPRWGGIGMWASMAITFLIVGHLPLVGAAFGRELTGIFEAATFVMLLGALDDRFDLDALTKFAGQALAGGILLLHGVQILWLPINGIYTLPSNIGQVLTVVFVMLVINAVNFIDGLDGLATGIVAICAIAFFAFSYILAITNGFNRAGAPSLVTAVVIGMCVGFLPFNYYPAKIFINAISGQDSRSTLVPLLLPFTILAIPFIDLLMAITRRLRAGRSPFAADREHLHHRLLDLGCTQREAVTILYLWTAMFALPTVVAGFEPLWMALLLAAIIASFSFLQIRASFTRSASTRSMQGMASYE